MKAKQEVLFNRVKDPGIGANQTIYDQAKNNSPGYDMYADGRERGIFIKMNGSELQGKVILSRFRNQIRKRNSQLNKYLIGNCSRKSACNRLLLIWWSHFNAWRFLDFRFGLASPSFRILRMLTMPLRSGSTGLTISWRTSPWMLMDCGL